MCIYLRRNIKQIVRYLVAQTDIVYCKEIWGEREGGREGGRIECRIEEGGGREMEVKDGERREKE